MIAHLGGSPAGLDEALRQSADILTKARLPVVGGLATDMAGARAAFAVAQAVGAVVDHHASGPLLREMELTRQFGGFVTSLGEVRNRADTVVVIGRSPLTRDPDLLDHLTNADSDIPRPGDTPRQTILIGAPDGTSSNVASAIGTGSDKLFEMLASLGAHVVEHPVDADALGADLTEPLREAAARLRASAFSVLVYDPEELPLPAIHGLQDIARELNQTTRATTFPLPGPGNVAGVNQLCGWTSGFPLRTSFALPEPHHDVWACDGRRLLKSGEADALLWVGGLDDEPPWPVREGTHLIALVPQGMTLEATPDVLIEVGRPGVDHAGAVYDVRLAAVVPLDGGDGGKGPGAGDILTGIAVHLGKGEAADADEA